jgi:hypothetical protein
MLMKIFFFNNINAQIFENVQKYYCYFLNKEYKIDFIMIEI